MINPLSEVAPWQRSDLSFCRSQVQSLSQSNLTMIFSVFPIIANANVGLKYQFHIPWTFLYFVFSVMFDHSPQKSLQHPCLCLCDPIRSSLSTAVGYAVTCAPVMQRGRVPSPVGTSFLGVIFSGFFLTCKTNIGKL